MSRSFRRPSLALATLAAAFSLAATAPATRFHARLVKSNPSKDTVLTAAPRQLDLWFSERIDVAASRVQLVDAAQHAVETGALWRDEKIADAPVVATVKGAMAPGTYTVNWIAAAGDGHPVRGSFNFTLRAP